MSNEPEDRRPSSRCGDTERSVTQLLDSQERAAEFLAADFGNFHEQARKAAEIVAKKEGKDLQSTLFLRFLLGGLVLMMSGLLIQLAVHEWNSIDALKHKITKLETVVDILAKAKGKGTSPKPVSYGVQAPRTQEPE